MLYGYCGALPIYFVALLRCVPCIAFGFHFFPSCYTSPVPVKTRQLLEFIVCVQYVSLGHWEINNWIKPYMMTYDCIRVTLLRHASDVPVVLFAV